METSLEIQIRLEVDEIGRHDVRDDDVAEELLDVTEAAKNNLLQEYKEGIFAVQQGMGFYKLMQQQDASALKVMDLGMEEQNLHHDMMCSCRSGVSLCHHNHAYLRLRPCAMFCR